MRRRILAALALCCLATTAHSGQGMNLRWDACLGDGGTLNKNFACDTNTGSDDLFVSFQLDSVAAAVTGLEWRLVLDTPGGAVGSWWQFKNTGTCRQTAFIPSPSVGYASTTCHDFWLGQAFGGFTAYVPPGYNPTTQTSVQGMYFSPNPATLESGNEYFAFRLVISHTKTVGLGACGGCLEPVCMGIQFMRLTGPVGNEVVLNTETQLQSSVASWQGSAVSSYLAPVDSSCCGYHPRYRVVTCAAAVPTRTSTWGALKALYR